MNSYWKRKALKHKGIKGEHAYLEAVEDFEKILKKTIKNLGKSSIIQDGFSYGYFLRFKNKYFKRK